MRRALTAGQHYENASNFIKDLAHEASSGQRPAPADAPQFTPPLALPEKRSSPKWLVAAGILLLIIAGVAVWQGENFLERLRIAQTSPPDLAATPSTSSTPEPAFPTPASRSPTSTPALIAEITPLEATPQSTPLAATPETRRLASTPEPTPLVVLPEPTALAATPEPAPVAAKNEPTPLAAIPASTSLATTPESTALAATPEPAPLPATASPTPLAATPLANPFAAIRVPTPLLTAPEPTLSPYLQALRVADELRRKDDLASALAAYAKIVERFPEEKSAREAMEMIAASLRERVSRMRTTDFTALRQPLERAAALNSISAQMCLGEMLRQSNAEDALRWFLAAGNQGQTEAMVFAGQMMASGRGVEAPDLPGAAGWFSKAAEDGDSGGMYALAECHLFGKGVSKDPKRAIELLTAASALNNPRAINLLGDLYRKGVPGLLQPNYQESVRLFSQAKDLGFLDAQGNLGVLYIYGQGVPKDVRKAFALFKDGAEKGNPLCMYFYAMCFDGGVAVEHDRESTRVWYVRAAQGGNRTAIEWCKKNNIPLASPP